MKYHDVWRGGMACLVVFVTLQCGGVRAADDSPRSATALWKDYDARAEPLDVEVVREWDEGSGHFKLVIYSLGTWKGTNKTARPRMAAYYGYPKGKTNSPAILHLHGGGQRAEKDFVGYWVNELGYAAMSINWGGNLLETKETPNTNWDGLAAGFNGGKDLKFHDEVSPGPNTLFKEPHGLNSSWMLNLIAARRALTFLERQPEVNAARLGVTGHSMGGNNTVLAAIDPRVKAAAPSVGGSGFRSRDQWGLPGSARRTTDVELYEKTASAESYWPLIGCPILFLGATNDFNSPTELVVRGMNELPTDTDRRLVLAPHLNHHFTIEAVAARTLWFEAHLKHNFVFPRAARAELMLEQPDGIPLFTVRPDTSSPHKIVAVDVYYGYTRDPRIRFWRDGQARQVGDHWEAKCPVFDIGEPLFSFANVTYEIDHDIALPKGYTDTSRRLTVTSDYRMAYPPALEQAGARATEKPRRLIDDFARGWRDWERLGADHRETWYFATHKLVDPSSMGPKGGKLAFRILAPRGGNALAVVAHVNDWVGYTGRKRDTYVAVVRLDSGEEQDVSLGASDFKNDAGQSMTDWNEITVLGFTPADQVVSNDPSLKSWEGHPPSFANLRWEGGDYIPRPPLESRKTARRAAKPRQDSP